MNPIRSLIIDNGYPPVLVGFFIAFLVIFFSRRYLSFDIEKMNGSAVGPVRTLVTSNKARGVSLAVLRRVIIVKNKIVKIVKKWVCVR
jgi:hypothetical protein